MKVFLGGSKSLGSLPEGALRRLEDLVSRRDEVLIGDCWGADELVQRLLGHYDRVAVYATEGKARHNANGWDVVAVDHLDKPPRIDRYGCAYYLEKDAAMALYVNKGRRFVHGVPCSRMFTCEVVPMNKPPLFTRNWQRVCRGKTL